MKKALGMCAAVLCGGCTTMAVPVELDLPLLLPAAAVAMDGTVTAATGVQNVGSLTAGLQGVPVSDIDLQLIGIELEPGGADAPTVGEMFEEIQIVLSRDAYLSSDDVLIAQISDLDEDQEEVVLQLWAPMTDPFNLMITGTFREIPEADQTVFARLQMLWVLETHDDESAGFELFGGP